MKNMRSLILIAAAALVTSVTVLAQGTGLNSQIRLTMQKPADARYRLLGEEELAQPDGKMFVSGVKIWNVVDRSTGSCFMMVFTQSGSFMAPTVCNAAEQTQLRMLDPNGIQ